MKTTAEGAAIEIDVAALRSVVDRIKDTISAEDYDTILGIIEHIVALNRLVRERGTTIARLRRLFHLSGTEKTDQVLDSEEAQADAEEPSKASSADEDTPDSPPKKKKKGKNKGRIPVSAYKNANRHAVPHPDLQHGSLCPACEHAKVTERKPSPIVRLNGKAPLEADLWELARYRCPGCGEVFTAPTPPAAQGDKYTESAASVIAVLHYGAGMPFHRLEKLQSNLQTPLPSSTQWDVMRARAESMVPVYAEMLRQAAQTGLFHSDDTFARILEFMGQRRRQKIANDDLQEPERTGIFTTGILAKTAEERKIALFFTGRRHAGENLAKLLEQRAEDLDPPVLMSDASSRNVPEGHPVVEANCNAHSRRNVVDEVFNFPQECRRILEDMEKVFKNDKETQKQKMSEAERLRFHQKNSGPILGRLRQFMRNLFREKRVEENSGLGMAIRYFIKHWSKLTLFLRREGVPLTNNAVERALKMVIRLRKNSYFYRSLRGAYVGDIYMSLIHTAEFHGANPVDYLTELQLHAEDVASCPEEWMPWNYRATLEGKATGPPSLAA